MNVWLVVVNERHSDTDAEVFTADSAAIGYARRLVRQFARDESDIDEELTESMRAAGWLYYASWSGEGDSIWVIEKSTDPWLADKASDNS